MDGKDELRLPAGCLERGGVVRGGLRELVPGAG